MNKVALAKIQAAFLIVIIVMAIAAGTAYWLLTTTKKPTLIWGDVFMDQPLVGATISIFDLAGNLLYTKTNATYETGSYLLDVSSITDQLNQAKGLRIVTHNGNLNNETFNGEVSRLIYTYNETTYYTLNPITTLIANYQSSNSQISHDQAENAVKHFLDVPTQLDLSYLIDNLEWDDTSFSTAKFMNEANAQGGYNNFINQLTNEIMVGTQHPFHSSAVGFGWGDAASFIGKGVAKGALSWAAGQGLNWIFHSLGGRTLTERTLEEVKKQLNEMSQQLNEVQKTVLQIEKLQETTLQKISEMTNLLEAKIEQMYKATKWNMEFNTLKLRSANLATAVADPKSAISTTFKRLLYFSKIDPSMVDSRLQTEINDTIDEILSPVHGIEVGLDKLNDIILGTLDMGLLEAWSTIVTIGAATPTQLQQTYDALAERFSYLLSLELLGVDLIIDAYHARYGNETTRVTDFWNEWKTKIQDQTSRLITVTEQITASRIDNVAANEFTNLNIYQNASATSTILQEADEFQQEMQNSLNAKENSQPTITVRVINYPEATNGNLPTELDLKLQNVDTGELLSPTTAARRDGETFHDWEFNTAPYELARYIFDASPGTYQICTPQNPNILSTRNYQNTLTIDTTKNHLSNGVTAYNFPASTPHQTEKITLPFPQNKSYLPISISGVDTDSDGNLYVADYGYASQPAPGRLLKFDSGGNLTLQWGKYGWGPAEFGFITGLAVDANNRNVYVQTGSKIQKYDTNGNFILEWKANSSGIAVDPQGYIYAIDQGGLMDQPLINKYDGDGNFILQWGGRGSADGKLNGPTAIACDQEGYIYVYDRDNCRIQKFDGNGNFMLKWGSEGTEEGQFSRMPGFLSVDKQGYIHLSDWVNTTYRIQKFDPAGNFITKWGGQLTSIGHFVFDIDQMDIYVSQRTYIQKFSIYPLVCVSNNW